MTAEMWSTERIRQELGASSIRSAMRIILRMGLTPVSREPGRSGMNLYEADAVRAAIAARPGPRHHMRTDVATRLHDELPSSEVAPMRSNGPDTGKGRSKVDVNRTEQ